MKATCERLRNSLMIRPSAALVFLLLVLPSCASAPGPDGNPPVDRIKAEHRMMQRNHNLALRENEVLKIENLKFKAEAAALSEEISRLMGELRALKETYAADMERMNAAYEDLCIRHETLVLESEALISDLFAVKQELEKNHAADVLRLNAQIEDQATAFHAEREALKLEFAAKTAEMDRRLADVVQRLRDKEAEILALAEKLKTAVETADGLERALQQTKNALAEKEKEKENQNLLSARKKLEAEVAAKQLIIDETSAPADSQTAPPPAPTQAPIAP